MEFSFKIWSAVRLKSDGTEMTITSCLKDAEGKETFTCKWKAHQELLMSDFALDELEAII